MQIVWSKQHFVPGRGNYHWVYYRKPGHAITYTLALWEKLTRFLDYVELELSNNLAGHSMRPIALGRKNWIQIEVGKVPPALGNGRDDIEDRAFHFPDKYRPRRAILDFRTMTRTAGSRASFEADVRT